MKMMKAALFEEINQLKIIKKEIPTLTDGEALVQVSYAGICGSDIHVYRGHHGTATYPRVPGHEFVGTLAGYKGTMKDGIIEGDTVVAQPFYSCGHCEPCVTGSDNVCKELGILGIHTDGCFAQYVKVPIKKLYKLPDGVDEILGAATEPLAVAVHDVRMSHLKCGNTALVSGGGPIGMLIAVVARLAGAKVYVSEVSDFRLEFAAKMGFETINPMKTSLSEVARDVNNGKGFDVIFETSGSKAAISQMTDAVKICGTIVAIGNTKEHYPMNLNSVFQKELKIVGVRIHSQQAFEGAISILESGQINKELYQIIDAKIFDLDDVAEAMEYCEKDMDHFKTLIRI